ncbi:hypothetical protein [Micromonospora haikouensis]|uniref:hypothetical protein n=1 Tax=Micromonospora haikouensis TaxID=686309 RepID=UPI003D923919
MPVTEQRKVIDIARDIVAEVAPDELSDFDFVASAYLRDPAAARRAGRAGAEPTAAGWEEAGHAVGVLAAAVVVDICKDLVVTGAKAAGRRYRAAGWWPFRGPAVGEDSTAPPIPPGQEERIRALAARRAADRGAPEALAADLAAALVKRWNARP